MLEDVRRRGGARGASFKVSRIRVFELATGHPIGQPFVGPAAHWLGVSGDLALTTNEDGALEGRSLRTGEVTLTMADLEALSPDIAGHLETGAAAFSLRRDGRLELKTNQARTFVVDPRAGGWR